MTLVCTIATAGGCTIVHHSLGVDELEHAVEVEQAGQDDVLAAGRPEQVVARLLLQRLEQRRLRAALDAVEAHVGVVVADRRDDGEL